MSHQSAKRFIAYSRCSTEEQGKNGTSHNYQIDGIRKSGAVRVAGCVEVGYFQDTATGTRFDNRGGLDAAHKICEAGRGQVDYLFVYRWDRLGRDVADCFYAIKRFEAVGTEVNCPDEWVDFTDPSWPLILSVKFGMAQSESMRISDRTKDGLHQRMADGWWPYNTPVGYIKQEISKSHRGEPMKLCVPCPEKSPIVREVLERYARAEAGKIELFQRFGKVLGIQRSQFCRIFHNPFYVGLLEIPAHRKEAARMVEGRHEKIISKTIFDACQAVAAETENGNKGKTWAVSEASAAFWLKGVIKCPESGRNHTAYSSRGKSGHHYAYYASPKVRGSQLIRVEQAHAIATRAMQEFTLSPEVLTDIRAEAQKQVVAQFGRFNSEAAKWRVKVEQAEKRLSSIRAMLADGQITPEDFREMRETFDGELLAAKSQLIEAERAMLNADGLVLKICDLLHNVGDLFAVAPPQRKTQILKAFFPYGFNVLNGKVRTLGINDVVRELCCNSMTYEVIEIENGTPANECPIKGG